ncbi:SRPBCC family protein [Roseiterribacter gracilis]|uniref:Activator of Hsp90 ATPase homologue 1/2-like C-terminal domain-containing protein n=1 Tax=Roseiterribacter gracilis TaxID=2812848 RepID=A0A8S8XCQ1_9PROT|nr:hypothetical protein TMPK1_12230 [Rhodospirillales bacterium TMPK1]
MTTITDIKIRRTYDVPAQRIYDAWTDPTQLRQWFTPGGTFEGDVRVGGTYQQSMPGSHCGGQSGTYLHLDPPRLIEFTWTSPNGTDGRETIVRIEILDLGTACELVLTHMRLPDDKMQGHAEGWTELGNLLAKHVGSK